MTDCCFKGILNVLKCTCTILGYNSEAKCMSHQSYILVGHCYLWSPHIEKDVCNHMGSCSKMCYMDGQQSGLSPMMHVIRNHPYFSSMPWRKDILVHFIHYTIVIILLLYHHHHLLQSLLGVSVKFCAILSKYQAKSWKLRAAFHFTKVLTNTFVPIFTTFTIIQRVFFLLNLPPLSYPKACYKNDEVTIWYLIMIQQYKYICMKFQSGKKSTFKFSTVTK